MISSEGRCSLDFLAGRRWMQAKTQCLSKMSAHRRQLECNLRCLMGILTSSIKTQDWASEV
ncbi:MAG: hypothetical protein CL917_06335 [Deltaproteobacteria bacterium]|nr:hypothetical protein [Deltaproteobacteria bacterium]